MSLTRMDGRWTIVCGGGVGACGGNIGVEGYEDMAL